MYSDFFMFYQIFLSPQVKRIVIVSNKYGIYELPHELPIDLRLRESEKDLEKLENLTKLGNNKKIPNLHRIIA